MPGRTQSPRRRPPGARRSAASRRCWQIERSPGRSCGRGVERGERGLDRRRIVGIGVGEVRHQRDRLDLRQRVEAQPRGAVGGRAAKPSRFMPLFIFRKTRCGRSVLSAASQSIWRRVVDDVPEVQARARLEVARVEAAFEQQDRAAPAELAQQLGLGDVEQREAVGALQRREDVGDAVAVGVGLDDRPDARAGRGAARDLEIGGEGVAMDQRFDRPRHGRNSASRPSRHRSTGRERAKTRVL